MSNTSLLLIQEMAREMEAAQQMQMQQDVQNQQQEQQTEGADRQGEAGAPAQPEGRPSMEPAL